MSCVFRFQKTLVQDMVSHSTVDKLGEAVQEFYVVRVPVGLSKLTMFLDLSEHG